MFDFLGSRKAVFHSALMGKIKWISGIFSPSVLTAVLRSVPKHSALYHGSNLFDSVPFKKGTENKEQRMSLFFS